MANGEDVAVVFPCTLEEFLVRRGMKPRSVVVELNRRAVAPSEKFKVIDGFTHPLIPRWEAFLAANGIGIAGIEFAEDEQSLSWTYDVNTNTNYNPDAEARAGVSGMGAIARHLNSLLANEVAAAAD